MRGYTQAHGKGWRYKIEFNEDEVIGDKKSISKSGFKKESEAKKALRAKLVELDEGKYIEDKKTTVESYLKEWVESYKSNVAASTYKRYKEFCNTINKHIGKVELLKLTPVTIQKFYSTLITDKKLSNSTILKIHRCFHLALKQAVSWNMINNNPSDHVKPPRAEKAEIKVWDEDTAKQFLIDARDENIYMPIALALGTGMREGEICALSWENWDPKKAEIYVRKTVKRINREFIIKTPKTKASIRRIPIASDLNDLLILHKKRIEKIFFSDKNLSQKEIDKKMNEMFVCCWEDDGRMYDPQYIAKRFPKILENYDVPKIRFHDLRHTHATILLLHDVPAKIVSERLGHSNIGITLDTYSHVLPSMQRKAAEKLNGLFSGAL